MWQKYPLVILDVTFSVDFSSNIFRWKLAKVVTFWIQVFFFRSKSMSNRVQLRTSAFFFVAPLGRRSGIPPWLTYIPNQVVEGPFHTSALQMQSQEISKPFSLMLTCCAQLSSIPMYIHITYIPALYIVCILFDKLQMYVVG